MGGEIRVVAELRPRQIDIMPRRETSTRRRWPRWGLYALVAALWIGANCIALACIDVYESRKLEAEFRVPAGVIRRYEWRQCDLQSEGSSKPIPLWYRFRPPAAWSGSHTVPLVVFLHGSGERGTDNVQQLRSLPTVLCEKTICDAFPCAVVAPQCPPGMSWSAGLDFNIDLLDGVMRMIDEALADRRIDPTRIYLIGLSMGGFGSWELAARAPERFAAVVPICGGGIAKHADRLVGVPLWAVHGADDKVVPVAQSKTMIEAVRQAGGAPRYLELPGVGHNCWDSVFRADSEVLQWMFQQSTTVGRIAESVREQPAP
jgi:pimeloyl-ACP methyl ester carboxylesterase